MKKDYKEEAEKLSKAIDIAVESFINFSPNDFTKDHVNHAIQVYLNIKKSILDPDPKFRNITSLKPSISEVFTYFQEASGQTVEYFWNRLRAENLDYKREDIMKRIINRGKIKTQDEYDLIIDSLVTALQEGRITELESNQLSQMLGKYDSRKI